MRDVLAHEWHVVMAEEGALAVQNQHRYTLKTYTKYSHSVCGRPTRKDVERFRNGSVRELYERSLQDE